MSKNILADRKSLESKDSNFSILARTRISTRHAIQGARNSRLEDRFARRSSRILGDSDSEIEAPRNSAVRGSHAICKGPRIRKSREAVSKKILDVESRRDQGVLENEATRGRNAKTRVIHSSFVSSSRRDDVQRRTIMGNV